MSDILEQLEFYQLAKLLPFHDNKLKLYTGGIMVIVQVNYFICGGVAISIYFKHVIADAFAAAIFIKTWAAIACAGSNYNIKDAVYGCASIFPPQDLPLQQLWRTSFENNFALGETVSRRLIFDATTIATLREKIVNGPCLDQPTRFEAITALIWGAAIDAGREREDFKAKNVALIPVSLRHKLNLASPEQCIGNVAQVTMAKWPTEKTIDYNSLAGKLNEAIMMMDENYARKLNEGGGFLSDLRNLNEEISDSNVFFVTSMFRSPLYEADFGFGWGKPKWANTVFHFNNFIFISDTCDGGGLEALVGLPKEDMTRFEKNPDIIAYASSFNPSI
ncbi:hypothetical protein QYF36_001650 [Acer negundo]|nr:hypothetical protein QYF36_001650 [Acer negundo]